MTGERRDDLCPHDELAVGWALHALEPDEEARLRDHLTDCVRCQRTVRSTHEVMAAMGGSVRQIEPPPRVRTRLMEAIEHTPQERPPSRPRHAKHVAEPTPLRPRRRSVLKPVLAAAALILVVGAGGVAGVKLNQLSNQVTAAENRNGQLERALGLMADPTTNSVLLRTDSDEPVAMLVSGATEGAVVPMKLSPNDSGHIYVVWGTSTKSPTPLATFRVGTGPNAPLTLAWNADAHKHTGFAVSLEPGETAPASPSTVIAAGQVA